MDINKIREFVEAHVDSGLIPALQEFVSIPSLSTDYDPEWETNGYMLQAMNVMIDYINSFSLTNYSYEVLKEPSRPWLYFGTLEATDPSLGTVLMYGHFDKQPHLEG